nr:tmv resistance protein n [Quercus suber]
MNPLLWYGISEEDVIISSHQREFLWVSFIPCEFLSPEWSRCNSVEFSFVSDNSDVLALKCGVDLVYRHKLEFTRTMVQCITSYDRPSTSYERFPFNHPNQFSSSDGSSGTSGHYSYECPYQSFKTAALDHYNNCSIFNQCIPRSEIVEWFSRDLLLSDLSPKFDFHPSTSYNFCFPPSKIQDWFSHPNHGHSVTIDLPSNLYHDSNWMGLVLYASFSIHGDPNIIFSNLASGKSHFLYCQCQTSMANVDDQTIAFSTNKEEITWLLNLGEFIWICYVPGEPFKNMLPNCSHIEASFMSDWSGVIVQNCALQLLYQHDQVQFAQELKHCNNLILENQKLVCKQQEDKKKINEQYHVDEGLQGKIFSNIDFEVKIFPRHQLETDETEIQLGQSDLLSFEKLKIIQMNGCPNLIETPDLIKVPNLEKMVLEDCLNLQELDMSGTTIREVPSSIGLLKNLKVLSFNGGKGLSSFNSRSWYDLLPFSSRPKIADPVGLSSLLGSLIELNLQNCNLSAISDDIGCLFSLEEIDLSENSFVCLPDSISQLCKLERMYLRNCTSLRSLPNLPVDIVEIWGDGCTSLETILDLQKPSAFCKGELYLSNCCKLADNQDFIDKFLAVIRMYHQGLPRHGRYDHRLYNWRYDMIISGSVIPKWFIHQSIGAEVNIKEPSSHLCDDWMGIAICIVFSYLLNFSLSCRLIANGKVMSATADFVQTANFVDKIGRLSENIWLCYLLPQYYEKDIKLLSECEANEWMVAEDNKAKQICDNFDGAGPSGEGSCNDMPHPNRIERLHGDSDCEEYFKCVIRLEKANNCVDKVESCRRYALVSISHQADQSNCRKVPRQLHPVVEGCGCC